MSTADVPNDVSKVFELDNWKTRKYVCFYKLYPTSDEAMELALREIGLA